MTLANGSSRPADEEPRGPRTSSQRTRQRVSAEKMYPPKKKSRIELAYDGVYRKPLKTSDKNETVEWPQNGNKWLLCRLPQMCLQLGHGVGFIVGCSKWFLFSFSGFWRCSFSKVVVVLVQCR